MHSTSLNRAPLAAHAHGQVEKVLISKLRPYGKNARTHSPRQIKQIAHSIEHFGFVNPILVDRNQRIICGHGRIAGARLLGRKEVPAITIEHLSEVQLRAYIIADNRLAEKAGWDKDTLAIELQGLADLEFDLELTGFEIPEIEVILDAADPARSEVEDEKLPELAPNSVVTRANDLWILGDHRLFCGDARRSDSFTTLLLKETADLVFVDPPYNVRISGHVSGKGRVKHREFAQASGEKTPCPFRKLYPRVR